MAYLVDTNVLARWLEKGSAQNAVARDSLKKLRRRGEDLYVTAQNLIELYVVATRAPAQNGLGMSSERAQAKIRHLRRFFNFAADLPAIYEDWLTVITDSGATGFKAHDARLAAVMHVYGLTHVLTFNTGDFSKFADITVVDPASV
jgi:predicted nucleic acid-binding protein